jgi:hypothetical protein
MIFVGYLLISNEPFDVPIKLNGIKITLDLKNCFIFCNLVLSRTIIYLIKHYPISLVEDYFDNKIIFTSIEFETYLYSSGFVSGIPAFFIVHKVK